MASQSIAFIGGGNMATSLVGGLIATGTPPDTVWVTDIDAEKLRVLQERFGVHTTGDDLRAVSRADTVVFAVKPQHMAEMVQAVAGTARDANPLVVSIAAGVREPDMRRWLQFDAAIVRTMPNTPALVGAGATALYANEHVSTEQRARAESVLRSVGITLWVETEDLLDAVTALSGSGPAYYFQLMEVMEEAGVALGLDRETARKLTLQTAFGASRIAMEGDESPATLRSRVTSPGGTTERALDTLREGGIEKLYMDALRAARDRSIELGREFG